MSVSIIVCILCVIVCTSNDIQASSIPLTWSDITVERRHPEESAMSVSIIVCILCVIVCTSNDIQASSIPLTWSDITVERRHPEAYDVGNERQKRGVIIGRAAMNGLKALRNLLKNTKPFPDADYLFGKYDNVQYHAKRGDYSQATKDFYSVDPQKVSHYEQHDGNMRTVGYVGDRIILMEKHRLEGLPSIEIIKPVQLKSDLIIYTR